MRIDDLQPDGSIERFGITDFNEEELWAIHDRVRQHDCQGQEWDRETMAGFMRALLDARATGLPALQALETRDLWQIDRQIDGETAVGERSARESFLPKVIRTIVEAEEAMEPAASDFPAPVPAMPSLAPGRVRYDS